LPGRRSLPLLHPPFVRPEPTFCALPNRWRVTWTSAVPIPHSLTAGAMTMESLELGSCFHLVSSTVGQQPRKMEMLKHGFIHMRGPSSSPGPRMRGKRSFSAEPCTAAHAEEIAFMRYVATFHFAQNSSSEADGEPTKLRADAPAFVLRAEAPAFVPMSISTHSTPTTVNKFNEPPPMTPLPSPALVPMAMPVMPVAMIGTSPSWWLSPQDMVCAPQPAPDSQASAPSLQKNNPRNESHALACAATSS